jgi:hypothetical protein
MSNLSTYRMSAGEMRRLMGRFKLTRTTWLEHMYRDTSEMVMLSGSSAMLSTGV